MDALSLVLAILMTSSPVLGRVFMMDQDLWDRGKQCKELILQHVLTNGESHFDPEVVRNCIMFLRSEHHEYQENHQSGLIVTKESSKHQLENLPNGLTQGTSNNQIKARDVKPFSEKSPGIMKKESEVMGEKTNHFAEQFEKEGKEKEKNNESVKDEDSNPTTSEDDEIIPIYPENIIQEWPAVEMVRKKREIKVEEIKPATSVKTKTRKITAPVVPAPSPPWEQHTALDDWKLDVRGRDRPTSFVKRVRHFFAVLLNRLWFLIHRHKETAAESQPNNDKM